MQMHCNHRILDVQTAENIFIHSSNCQTEEYIKGSVAPSNLHYLLIRHLKVPVLLLDMYASQCTRVLEWNH